LHQLLRKVSPGPAPAPAHALAAVGVEPPEVVAVQERDAAGRRDDGDEVQGLGVWRRHGRRGRHGVRHRRRVRRQRGHVRVKRRRVVRARLRAGHAALLALQFAKGGARRQRVALLVV